jgi:hypothetical protein
MHKYFFLSIHAIFQSQSRKKQITIKHFIENMYLNLETPKNKQPQKLLKKETRGVRVFY